MAKLMRYSDAEYLREATPEEQRASISAAARAGGAGVIVADGARAYVEHEAADVERLSEWLENEEDERLYSEMHDRYDTALRLAGRA